jgi:hypothetical protein
MKPPKTNCENCNLNMDNLGIPLVKSKTFKRECSFCSIYYTDMNTCDKKEKRSCAVLTAMVISTAATEHAFVPYRNMGRGRK